MFVLGLTTCLSSIVEATELCRNPLPMWSQSWTFHRITKWLRLKETSEDCLVRPSVQAGSPRAGCSRQCPAGFWRSPRIKTHRLSGQPIPVFDHSHCKKQKFNLSSRGISCISIYDHCFLCCHWTPLKKSWVSFLFHHCQVLIHTDKIPLEPSLVQTEQTQLSPHMSDILVPE